MNKNPWLKGWLSLGMMMMVLAGCASTATQQSTGEYIDDATITSKVKAAFVSDKQVSALDIHVTTYNGVVQLSGFADNPDEVQRATELARNVEGVKAVRNDVQLK
ncbi:MAG: BON domain-containing protein [Burkholderiales bacterium]